MNKKIFIAIGIFWLMLILGFVAVKEFTLQTGEEILLKTRPVDPRDLFRGDYIILNYEISTVNAGDTPIGKNLFTEGETIYVRLEREGEYGVFSGGLSRSPYPEGLFIKGKVREVRGGDRIVEYGIESYFVPEGEGWEIQGARGLEVKVAIDKNGRAGIKSLLIEGQEVRFATPK